MEVCWRMRSNGRCLVLRKESLSNTIQGNVGPVRQLLHCVKKKTKQFIKKVPHLSTLKYVFPHFKVKLSQANLRKGQVKTTINSSPHPHIGFQKNKALRSVSVEASILQILCLPTLCSFYDRTEYDTWMKGEVSTYFEDLSAQYEVGIACQMKEKERNQENKNLKIASYS